ncbi:hypothetical protein BKI52_43390 [marine bacterium AO1-C]|nr:hypothetical protein BKI52_43390 [marine bacterium AO1-C]
MFQAKVLVVEDEFSIALDIQVRLQKMGYTVSGIAHNYDQALQCIKESAPDIVLMDIHLSGKKSGIDTAREVYTQYQIPIVFLTAYGDEKTFEEALQSQPFGYLLKPFKDQDLNFTLKLALQKKETFAKVEQPVATIETSLTETLFVKDKSQFTAVKIEDILWVEAMDNYVLIVTNDKKVVANLFLKDIELKLPTRQFLRVHRSYIIALNRVEKIEENTAYIADRPIPISKSHKAQLIARLNIL